MEHLLNFLWLMSTLGLFLSLWRARSRGQLRCSLAVAVACTALLALVLFPALSMTDDLQRARLDVETNGKHLGTTFLLGSPEDSQSQAGAIAAALVLLLIAFSRRTGASILPRSFHSMLPIQLLEFRPAAVRPPPAPAI